jgi:hypothetical protein
MKEKFQEAEKKNREKLVKIQTKTTAPSNTPSFLVSNNRKQFKNCF